MSTLTLSLLGPPRIERDGVPVHVPRHKAVALLAYLAVTGQTHRRDALAALLWPEHDQRRARAGLRRALAALKDALGEGWLDAQRESVGLSRDAEIELDVGAFRERLAGCREHGHPSQEVCPACLSLLAEAVALYRDDFLAGFTLRDSRAFDDWQFFQTQGLRDELAGALERLVQGHSARGEFEPAIATARRWLSLDPLHEPAHRRLMELYAWSGQRAAALRQYGECERILQEELSAPPGEETVELYQAIVAHRERPSPVERDGGAQRPSPAALQNAASPTLPTGTVTFLFTDIQGSTPLWERKPRAMKAAVARHHAILRGAIQANGGVVFKIVGDAFQAAFDLAAQGLWAALDAQRALRDQEWGEAGPLRVRMGLHTGPAELAGDDYAVSHTLNRVARVMSAGHGGQILLSQEAADLVSRELPPGVSLRDMGDHYVKGMAFPERLFQVVAPDLPQDFPPLVTVDKPRHNLPAQLIPFVGRQAVLAEIGQRLADPGCRLLTLVGPGGSGKTRLALEAAAQQVDRYPHGVFFVSLAPLDAIETIVPAIAQSLGFTFHGEREPKEQLLSYLREKSMLLVLDNVEHLLRGHLADVSSITTDILQAAPQVVILVTSRVGLHVQGEHRFPVEGMDVPALSPSATLRTDPGPSPTGEIVELEDAAQYSAIKLFLESAHRVQPDFALSAEVLPDMVRICLLVEGMPLGILLAAAWVALFAPGEIADEIDRGLDFLESDLRDVPDRQRSLRAAFDYSWNLLTGQDRAVFAALSVFRGGFTREAAQDVTGVSLRGLMALADKSLLHRTPGGRYEVHELLRQYAAEKLATSPDAEQQVRDRHCAFYAAALQRWDAELKGPRQLAALAEVEADIGNAVAAWEWAVKRGHVQELDRAMDGLCRFYEWRGRYEEGDAACRAVEGASALDEEVRVRAKATAWRGAFNRALRRLERAKGLLEESLAHLETLASSTGQDIRQEKAFALWQLGYTMYDLGNSEDVRQRYEDSLTLYRALDDRWGMASVSYHLGDSICMSGAPYEAEALVRESLAIQQDLGDHREAAGSLRVLSVIAVSTGRLGESERLAQESVAIFQTTGDRAHAAEALLNWGYALVVLGRLAEARSRLEESVAIYRDLGFGGSSSSLSLSFLGQVDTLLGRYEEAGTRAQEALALARERGYRNGIGYSLLVLGMLAIAAGEYAQVQQILQMYSALEGPVLLQFMGLPFLGYAARGLGQPDRARQHLCETLRLASEAGELSTTLLALPMIALLLADEGKVEWAVELYALASRYPYVANSQWFEDVAGVHIAAAAEALSPEEISAAQERGRARDLWATVEELLIELEDA